MTHYTLSGMYAGQVICGNIKNEQDNYLHFGAMYGRPHPIDLCKECLEIVNSLDDED